MSTIYKEQDFTQTNTLPEDKIVLFLNDLRDLLDKHNVKLYTTSCELFINNLGFIFLMTLDIFEKFEVSIL